LTSNNARYELIKDDDLLDILRQLIDEFNDYLKYGLGYSENQYLISGLVLIDIIIRVDKRLSYFRYFHGMKINDRKKAALYAYWIIKLRPVTIIDDNLRNKVDHSKVNERLAFHHLLKILIARGKVKTWDGHEGVNINESNKFIKEMIYSFRFRNFTIDSMIVLADSITTDTFKEVKKS